MTQSLINKSDAVSFATIFVQRHFNIKYVPRLKFATFTGNHWLVGLVRGPLSNRDVDVIGIDPILGTPTLIHWKPIILLHPECIWHDQWKQILPARSASTPIEDENQVIHYMTACPTIGVSGAMHNDVITDKPIGGSNLQSDGIWAWYSLLRHYIVAHHCQLPPTFLRDIKSKNWKPPKFAPNELIELNLRYLFSS